MARRTLVDIEDKIIEAVIEIGSQEGINAITSQKVAKLCGVSHFTCFNYFETRQGMLDAAAKAVERKFLKTLVEDIKRFEHAHDIWEHILDTLLKYNKAAIYYWNYCKLFENELEMNSEQATRLLPYAKQLFRRSSAKKDLEFMMLWDHALNMAFYYTDKITRGIIANTPESRKYISDIVFMGLH